MRRLLRLTWTVVLCIGVGVYRTLRCIFNRACRRR